MHEIGEKSGGKGAKNEAVGENVEAGLSAGDSDEVNENCTQHQALQKQEGKVCDRDRSDGQRDEQQSMKIGSLGTWDTGTWDTSNTSSAMMQADGEPNESDVVYNLSGSIGFSDRSFGSKFLMPGKKKTGVTSASKSMTVVAAAQEEAMVAVAMSTTKATAMAMETEMASLKAMASTTVMVKEARASATATAEATMKTAPVTKTAAAAVTTAVAAMMERVPAARNNEPAVANLSMAGAHATKSANRKPTTEEFMMEQLRKRDAAAAMFGYASPRSLASVVNSQAGGGSGKKAGSPNSKLATTSGLKNRQSASVKDGTTTSLYTIREEAMETKKQTGNRSIWETTATGKDWKHAASVSAMAEVVTATATNQQSNPDQPGEAQNQPAAGKREDENWRTEANQAPQQENFEEPDQYRVRYEYTVRRNEATRVTSVELRNLAAQLWQADPTMIIHSLNNELRPIHSLDDFPSNRAEYDEFFERVVTQIAGVTRNVVGFAIQAMYQLHELKDYNGKQLQRFLQDKRSFLRVHHFESLLTEQIGWFACKTTGVHLDRFEYDLGNELEVTKEQLNATEDYAGSKRIINLPGFEVSKANVYESGNESQGILALNIRCESHNAEMLKTILVQADLDVGKFGTFMLFTTRLSDPALHESMYHNHLVLTQDTVAITVEGLHDDVLQEEIQIGPNQFETVKGILLRTTYLNERPIRSIEYTYRSDSDGRFLFITDREGVEGTAWIIANTLTALARSTNAYETHRSQNNKFSRGICRVQQRMTRSARHENGVRARHAPTTEEERSRARQGTRNRPVVVIDAPWTLEEYPLLPTNTDTVNHRAGATYAQAAMAAPRSVTQSGQRQGKVTTGQTTWIQQGTVASGNQSSASGSGNDDSATIQSLLSSIAEQSQQIQALIDGQESFKSNVQTAVEARLQQQQGTHQDALAALEKRQEERNVAHLQEIQEKDKRHQMELIAVLESFKQRDVEAANQQLARDESNRRAVKAERDTYNSNMVRLINEARNTAAQAKEDFQGSMNSMGKNLLTEIMRQLAPLSISSSPGPMQEPMATPLRTKLPQETVPVTINVDTRMEDCSPISAGKRATEEVCSPPRIGKNDYEPTAIAHVMTKKFEGNREFDKTAQQTPETIASKRRTLPRSTLTSTRDEISLLKSMGEDSSSDGQDSEQNNGQDDQQADGQGMRQAGGQGMRQVNGQVHGQVGNASMAKRCEGVLSNGNGATENDGISSKLLLRIGPNENKSGKTLMGTLLDCEQQSSDDGDIEQGTADKWDTSTTLKNKKVWELPEGGDEQETTKRQRPKPAPNWRDSIRKVKEKPKLAIVQQTTSPRLDEASPDRKKRAAPSPNRAAMTESDAQSMTSTEASELASTVFNQIQEASTEANAPSGPRKNVL
jgi:hypothetical protein